MAGDSEGRASQSLQWEGSLAWIFFREGFIRQLLLALREWTEGSQRLAVLALSPALHGDLTWRAVGAGIPV